MGKKSKGKSKIQNPNLVLSKAEVSKIPSLITTDIYATKKCPRSGVPAAATAW